MCTWGCLIAEERIQEQWQPRAWAATLRGVLLRLELALLGEEEPSGQNRSPSPPHTASVAIAAPAPQTYPNFSRIMPR